MRVALKEAVWERDGETLLVVCDHSKAIELHDPTGQVETLLRVLADQPGPYAVLRERLSEAGAEVTAEELEGALGALDALRLLRDPDAGVPAAEQGRYFSNFAFFELFVSRETSAAEYQRRLREAHVLQLGTGGLGSNVLQSLAGLGVGRLTLVDSDVVEPRNFARQFLYREADIGCSKVERAAAWLRAFHSGIEVNAIERWVAGPEDLTDLLDGVDLVVSGIDQPNQVDSWVNQACVYAAVPWVRGGMSGSQLLYFSVDPGRSACHACRAAAYGDDGATASQLPRQAERARQLSSQLDRLNRGIGPAAALVGSLVAFEALRYLTGFQPPYGAGADVIVEVADGCQQRKEPWPADPDCQLCAAARAARDDLAPEPAR
ncbi:MAG: HesA/MoeB/ThiF family protein [Micromonosporaceae bacterium]